MSKKSKSVGFDGVKARLKHQSLMQDFGELHQEVGAMRGQLMAAKHKKSILAAEVRFLRRRYQQLIEAKKMNSAQESLVDTRIRVKENNNTIEQLVQRKEVIRQQKPKKKQTNGKRVPFDYKLIPISSSNHKGRINITKEAMPDSTIGATPSIPAFDLNQDSRPEASLRRHPVFDLNEVSFSLTAFFLVFEMDSTKSFTHGIRVLVVDNDLVSLENAAKILTQCNYKVTKSSSGREALDLIRQQNHGFDVILSDVNNMSGVNGFMLLEQVKHLLPVILMSIHNDERIAIESICHGACFFIEKPLSRKELKNIWQFAMRKQLEDRITNRAEDGNTITRTKKKRDVEPNLPHKKFRLGWTDELHQKFLQAMSQLKEDEISPKKIQEKMGFPWLTREHVASHLQKYRLNLSRIQKGSVSDSVNAPSSIAAPTTEKNGPNSNAQSSDVYNIGSTNGVIVPYTRGGLENHILHPRNSYEMPYSNVVSTHGQPPYSTLYCGSGQCVLPPPLSTGYRGLGHSVLPHIVASTEVENSLIQNRSQGDFQESSTRGTEHRQNVAFPNITDRMNMGYTPCSSIPNQMRNEFLDNSQGAATEHHNLEHNVTPPVEVENTSSDLILTHMQNDLVDNGQGVKSINNIAAPGEDNEFSELLYLWNPEDGFPFLDTEDA